MIPQSKKDPLRTAERWRAIGLSTDHADRKAAESYLDEAYLIAGLELPKNKIWLGSPSSGCLAASALSLVDNCVWAEVYERVEEESRSLISSEVPSRIWEETWRNFEDTLYGVLWKGIRNLIIEVIDEQLRSEKAISPSCKARICGYGHLDTSWLGVYGFLADVYGIEDVHHLLEGISGLTRNCGFWWPFRHWAILTERPIWVQLDDKGDLHCETGPALLYPDGWTVWAWHGRPVSQDIIEHPETITLGDIRSEDNPWARRVLIDRYGLKQYMLDSGADVIHKDECGELYFLENSADGLYADEPLAMVKVRNSTVGPYGAQEEYFLRVPPDIKAAREAVAWTFGLDYDNYKLEEEK